MVKKFQILPGERRKDRRKNIPTSGNLDCKFGNELFTCVGISESSLGRLVLNTNQGSEIIDAPRPVGTIDILEISSNGATICDGLWKLSSVNQAASAVVFERKEVNYLSLIARVVEPKAVLRSSMYRVFDTSNTELKTDFMSHFTELKECPTPIKVTVLSSNGKFTSSFDFTSDRATIEILDFSLPKDVSIDAGNELIFDYSFLTTRYVFSTTVLEVDSDFEVFSVTAPDFIFSSSCRRYQRHACEERVKIKFVNTNESISGYAKNVSVTSILIETENPVNDQSLGSAIEIELRSLVLKGIVARVIGRSLLIDFIYEAVPPVEVVELLNTYRPKPLIVRQEEMYDQLIVSDLFTQVAKPRNLLGSCNVVDV